MKPNENYDKESELLSRRLGYLNSYWTRQYREMRLDLRFMTGDQWTPEAVSEREEDGRPIITNNFIQNQVDSVVNKIRKNPFGIRVKHKKKEINELIQGIIRDIEYKSDASEAYEMAFENGSAVGLGFIVVETAFEDDTTLNQVIRIRRVSDPTSVYIDPTFDTVNGKDAKYAAQIKYRDKDEIDFDKYGPESEYIMNYDSLYNEWIAPENTVPELIYWSLEEDEKKRVWTIDGRYWDDPDEIAALPEQAIAGERTITNKYVNVCKYLGGLKVAETKLDLDFIPVIPVVGDRVFEDAWRGFGGIVRRGKNAQQMINYYAASEAEIIQSAPISQWLTEEGAIEGYEDDWSDANNENLANLTWKGKGLDGTPNQKPERIDNTARTEHLTRARLSCIDDLQRVTGIFDSQLGKEGSDAASGRAILLRQQGADLSNYQYVDNLMKSITQTGRIVVQLILSLYDVERKMDVRGEDGSVISVNGNIQELGIRLEDFDTEVEAGPLLQNEKDMTNAMILEVGRINPEQMPLMSDILIENLSSPGSEEIVKRLRKNLPAGMVEDENGENAPDPQAMAAMQSAQQTIEELKKYTEQLESIIVSGDRQNAAKLEEASIEAQTDMAKAELDSATKIMVAKINAGVKLTVEEHKIQNKNQDRFEEMMRKFAENNSVQPIVDNYSPDVDVIEQSIPGASDAGIELKQESAEVVEDIDDLIDG